MRSSAAARAFYASSAAITPWGFVQPKLDLSTDDAPLPSGAFSRSARRRAIVVRGGSRRKLRPAVPNEKLRRSGMYSRRAHVTLLLDAGAFSAVERDDRNLIALIKRELNLGRTPLTHGAVVGHIWRGASGRQAGVARLLRAVEVVSVDDALGRRAGLLLRSSKTRDVVDAALVPARS